MLVNRIKKKSFTRVYSHVIVWLFCIGVCIPAFKWEKIFHFSLHRRRKWMKKIQQQIQQTVRKVKNLIKGNQRPLQFQKDGLWAQHIAITDAKWLKSFKFQRCHFYQCLKKISQKAICKKKQMIGFTCQKGHIKIGTFD